MYIKPSAVIRQNYNDIAQLCKDSGEPVYLTKNGEGDLVVMDIEAFEQREKMLDLREKLLSVKEDRVSGKPGCSLEALDLYLEAVIDEVSGYGTTKAI
ncbi:MAG: type II toxin-antitoxin system prevent-host-death family antitoxin [Sphaerochaetaceae bacterium]|nr:type II toxin-antitoxin system prevent-host-death family antitoxin [Sphaerochaetaceae bacterium]